MEILLKEQDSSSLLIEHGAQMACSKVYVHQARKGPNPNTIHSRLRPFTDLSFNVISSLVFGTNFPSNLHSFPEKFSCTLPFLAAVNSTLDPRVLGENLT